MNRMVSRAAVMILVVFLTSFFSVRSAPFGQTRATKPFVLGEVVTMTSKILGEDRELYIYTHPAYGEDESRYPVAYVLDGEWNFRHTSGVIDLLSSREVIPWMIVVGIPNRDRNKDLSPSPIKDVPRGGGAAAFRRFLREEVFPYIETRYRTEPFRLVIGHSLSGLFSIDTLLSDPTLFNAYLAVSPWLIWDENKYLDAAAAKKATLPERLTFLSVYLGAEPNLEPALERLWKILPERGRPGLERHCRILPEFDHETVYLQAVVRGLLDIFHDWRLPPAAVAAGLEGIRKHYDGLTARYGYAIRPVYFVVNMIGSEFKDRGAIDEAIRILEYAVSLNPGLPYAYVSLGDCFRQKGLIKEAIQSYEKALQLSPEDAYVLKALKELKK